MINLYYAKTTYSEISHLKKSLNFEEKIDSSDIIIAEDRFTLSLEQEILFNDKKSGSFSTNVYSFQRLFYTLNKNLSPKTALTKTGGIMAISKILSENADSLLCYNKIAKSYTTLSQSLYEIIAQLKSSCITPKDLEDASFSSVSLGNKAKDIAKIYSIYESYKEGNLFDAADMAELLKLLIPTSDLIKNSNIYIVGFTSFTRQFYSVISLLFKYAKNVTIYILDGENDVYDKSVKDNIKMSLSSMALKYEEKSLIDYANEEVANINRYLFSFTPKEMIKPIETDKVSIYEAVDFIDELNNLAVEILKLVRIKNYRYSDISVIMSNLTDNTETIKREFKKYDIPIFIDNKVLLSDHILPRIVISILSLSSGERLISDVLNVLYSPYFELDQYEKYQFENYLVKYGVNKKYFAKRLKDSRFEEIKDKIFDLCVDLKKTDEAKNYCEVVKKIIDKLSVSNEKVYNAFIAADEKEQAELTRQASDKFIDTLNELTIIMGDSLVSFTDFVSILKDGLSAKELSLAPLFSDTIFIGDFSSSKISRKPALFALTVNNNLVPMVKKDVGIITDKDIDGLLQSGIDLEPKIELVNERERLNVFLALHNFSTKLYLSYSNFDLAAERMSKSEIIESVSNIFTKNGVPISPTVDKSPNNFDDKELSEYLLNKVTSKQIAMNLAAQSFSKASLGDKDSLPLFSSIYHAMDGKEKEVLQSLFEKQEKIVENAFCDKTMFSVSDLESYFACPYKNFISHSLYAKDREVSIVKANVTGDYIHKALELFVPKIDEIDSVDSDKFNIEVKNVLSTVRLSEPYLSLSEITKSKIELNNLDREFVSVAKELVSRKTKVKYSSLGEEISFGKNGSVINLDGKNVLMKPYQLTDKISLHGKIDYADRYKNYIRVIDYKTGSIHSSFSSIYTGQKFQPFIYLASLSEALNLTPSASLYFPIQSKFIKNDKDENPYKMEGQILNDMEALKAMDSNLEENSKAEYIFASVIKSGALRKDDDALTKEEFSTIIDYSKKLAKKACKEIIGGYIEPKPYKDSCDFCNYSSICGYNVKIYGERYIEDTIKKETIIKAAEEDDEI